ncbi:hypothetical protein RSAG8_11962, partial [Rhizoctonia solani AG-8 WAC10335]
MKRHEFPRDENMPPTAEPRRWFTKNQLKSNKEHLTESIESLMEWIEINEKFKPPWSRQPTDSDPGLLQCIPADEHDLPEFISSFQFPPVVYNYDASNHESYTIIQLWNCWALQKLFVDLQSGALALPDITFQVSFGKDQQNLLTTICDHIDSLWGPRFIDLMVEGHVADYRLEWPYLIIDQDGTKDPIDLSQAAVAKKHSPTSYEDTSLAVSSAMFLQELEGTEPDTTQQGLADELSLGPVIYAHAGKNLTSPPGPPSHMNPNVPGRPQMKPTPAQSTATIVGDQKELTPVTGTDLYAAFEQLTQNEPNPTVSRSTDLFERKVINTSKDWSCRSPSKDSRPGTSHMAVEDNALGLQSLNAPQPLVSLYHDFETEDVTFNAPDDVSTPNIKYLPLNTHPVPGRCPPQTTRQLNCAISNSGTQSPSLIVSASHHSATTRTSVPNSASSSSHLTPGDAKITGSMLGRAAQVLGRGSAEIESPTDDNASRASAMVSTRWYACVATVGKCPHMGSEEEEPDAPTGSKKNRSNAKSTERWK